MTELAKIFIGCLPSNSNKEEIHSYFSNYCSINKLKISFRTNGICAGYGHFTTEITKTQLEELLNKNHTYMGRVLECRLYMKGKQLRDYLKDFNSRRVHVNNIPKFTTDQELYLFFKLLCNVEKAYIANQSDANDHIFGFVIAKDSESAEKLIEMGEVKYKGCRLLIAKSTCQKLESLILKEKEQKKRTQEKKRCSKLATAREQNLKTLLDQGKILPKQKRILKKKRIVINKYHRKLRRRIKLVSHSLPNIEHCGAGNLRLNKRMNKKSTFLF